MPDGILATGRTRRRESGLVWFVPRGCVQWVKMVWMLSLRSDLRVDQLAGNVRAGPAAAGGLWCERATLTAV
jgi:hypothetical protein